MPTFQRQQKPKATARTDRQQEAFDRSPFVLPDDLPRLLESFICSCLSQIPNARPSALDAIDELSMAINYMDGVSVADLMTPDTDVHKIERRVCGSYLNLGVPELVSLVQ